MGTFQQTLILISTLILIKNSQVLQENAEGDCILRNEIYSLFSSANSTIFAMEGFQVVQ